MALRGTGDGGRADLAGAKPTYLLIQVLRALAALMVVAHHATIMLFQRDRLFVQTWIAGSSGVDIFFVISGFVMTISTRSLRVKAGAARTFLLRRLERVVPLYWLVTIVKVAVLLLAPALAVNSLGGWQHVLASFLFVPSLSQQGLFEPVVVVGWTLNFEMAFYLCFAVALALRWRPLLLLAPLFVLIPLCPPLGVSRLPSPLWFYISTLLWEFLFGMVLGAVVPWVRRLRWGWGLLLMVAGLACLLLLHTDGLSVWRGLVWGLPALAVVAGAIVMEARWGARSPRWALELGDASYSIYLVHTFVLPLIGLWLIRWPHGWSGEVAFAITASVILSALAGEALYRVVELPIMRWFKGKRRPVGPQRVNLPVNGLAD